MSDPEESAAESLIRMDAAIINSSETEIANATSAAVEDNQDEDNVPTRKVTIEAKAFTPVNRKETLESRLSTGDIQKDWSERKKTNPADLMLQKTKEGSFTITFEDVTYEVDIKSENLSIWENMRGLSFNGFPKVEVVRKTLLSNVTGSIKPGQMTALMGPSGAGKSTLLDVLSQRKNAGYITGNIFYNAVAPDSTFDRIIGYVEQKDILIHTLTPREIFYYSARIRLPKALSKERIEELIENIIEELSLEKCADTMIGNESIRGISGGQAKRVNIGIELITDPKVMFLDEPTTGLDSVTAFDTMLIIKKLTQAGRTTICTIHQPSTEIFNLFDKLLLLVQGETVYLGDRSKAVKYFENHGFTYRLESNPADFVVDVLANKLEGSKDDQYKTPRYWAMEYTKSSLKSDRLHSTQKTVKRQESKLKKAKNQVENRKYENDVWHNFKYLFIRTMSTRKRDIPYFVSRVLRVGFIMLLVATVFPNVAKQTDVSTFQSQVSVYNFCVMPFSFGALALLGMIIQERQYMMRERNAKAFQIEAFYVSSFLSEYPAMLVQSVVFACVVYWSVGFYANAGAFFGFILLLFVISDIGYAIAQTFSFMAKDMETASIFILPVIIVSFLFSGFYVRRQQIPDYWVWAYYISYIQYAMNGVSIITMPLGDSFRTDTAGTPVSNDELLSQYGLGSVGALSKWWENLLVLLAMLVFWRIVAFISLKYSRHGSR